MGLAFNPSPSSTVYTRHIQERLRTTVRENGLQAFYDDAKIGHLVARLATVDFDALAAKFKIGKELVFDLAALALYDVVFFCDDSGSMAFEENSERIADLKFMEKVIVSVFSECSRSHSSAAVPPASAIACLLPPL